MLICESDNENLQLIVFLIVNYFYEHIYDQSTDDSLLSNSRFLSANSAIQNYLLFLFFKLYPIDVESIK